MDRIVTLAMDGENIRFTEDGKMSVVDAISLLSKDESPVYILEKLKQKDPRLEKTLETITYEGESVTVTDSQNWEIIQILLLDYIINGER